MDLFLLRHAIPVEPEHWIGPDRARPLTEVGREQLRQVIRVMQPWLRIPTLWSSPYLRAEETARIAGELLGGTVRVTPALVSGLDLFRSLPHQEGSPSSWPDPLVLVGHQPDLGLLIGDLCGPTPAPLGLGRSGIAHLQGEFRSQGMKLKWLLTAEQITAPDFHPPDH